MEITAEVAFIIAGALGAAFCISTLSRRLPPYKRVFERSLRPVETADRWPAQLVQLEQVVGWSGASALDAHTRLRPVLVEIADARLARRGLRLDRDAAEAQRLLGPRAWDLVRPDRPPPRDPDAPGIAPRELSDVLGALEVL